MSETGLMFLENQAGEVEGLGHAGIETFRDTPFVSCSREAGQNTLDAADGKPVQLVMREHNVPATDIPGIEKLRETIRVCRKAARNGGSEKDRDFFENAHDVISRDTIPVLEIADYNTTGLEGPPNDNGSKFHALVKSSGKSNKSTETSGGSFGIGKNATFAVSDLRTVYYSTIYDSPEGEKFALQGKVQLVSHEDVDGVPRTSKGYWGYVENFTAVEDPSLIPEWMRRTTKGTSVFSIGFRGREDWIERMTVPLISNFFAAVDDGFIEFEVGAGERIVNGATLAELLDDPAIEAAADEASHGDDMRLARKLYRCRKSDEAVTKRFRVDGLGEFTAKILVEEGMPKRVAIVRNGMLIAQSLEHFGDKFARFAGARDFVMLVEPADDEASKVLKSLENPQHNAFSAGRLDDPEKQKAVARAMKQLIHEIRTLIRENAEIAGGEAVKLDELGEFFADAGSEDAKVPSAENDPETFVYKPAKRVRPKPVKPVAAHTEGDDGGAGTAERIRDKIAASKRKGLWMGGNVPLGYQADGRTLKIDEGEAGTVRTLFDLYRDNGNIRLVKEHAEDMGLRSRRRTLGNGRISGGKAFDRGHIHHILSNPIYAGRIRHKGSVYEGQHPAIIDPAIWDEVQRMLAGGAAKARGTKPKAVISLLAGKIFDETGDRLTPSHSRKNGKRLRYYISRRLVTDRSRKHPDAWRLPAVQLEQLTADLLRAKLSRPDAGAVFLRDASAAEIEAASMKLTTLRAAKDCLRFIERIDLKPGELSVLLNAAELANLLGYPKDRINADHLLLNAPFRMRRRGVELKMHLGEAPPEIDRKLVSNIVKAQRWMAMILDGKTFAEIVLAEGTSKRRVQDVVDLAMLAPDVLDAVASGEQPDGLTSDYLIKSGVPILWTEQRETFDGL